MDIREIARRAKVSTATVSRAINHVPTVDPQLAKRVWKVVEELGYYPKYAGSSIGFGAESHFWPHHFRNHQSLFPGGRSPVLSLRVFQRRAIRLAQVLDFMKA
jgi:hypothetical protein